jgi:hypothetical protein
MYGEEWTSTCQNSMTKPVRNITFVALAVDPARDCGEKLTETLSRNIHWGLHYRPPIKWRAIRPTVLPTDQYSKNR